MKRVEITGNGGKLHLDLTDNQYQTLTNAQTQQEPAFLLEFRNADDEVTKKVIVNTRQILALEVTDTPEPSTEPTASMEASQAVNKTKAKTA